MCISRRNKIILDRTQILKLIDQHGVYEHVPEFNEIKEIYEGHLKTFKVKRRGCRSCGHKKQIENAKILFNKIIEKIHSIHLKSPEFGEKLKAYLNVTSIVYYRKAPDGNTRSFFI